MDVLNTALQVVLPIGILLAIGYAIRKLGWIDESTVRQMNTLAFRLVLPINLFMNVYSAGTARNFNWELILFTCGGMLAVFIAAVILVPAFMKEPAVSGTMIQGIYRSNLVIFGITYIEAIYGSGAAAPVTVPIAFAIGLANILGVLSFTIQTGDKFNYKKTALDLLRNPMIVAVILSGAFVAFRIPIPSIGESVLSQISRMTTPLVIILIGAGFRFDGLREYAGLLTWVSALRLVIIPLVVIAAAVFLGFRNEELIFLLASFGGPNATISYTVASQMGGDDCLAADIVVVTTILSILSVFGFVYCFAKLSLI